MIGVNVRYGEDKKFVKWMGISAVKILNTLFELGAQLLR